MADNMQLPPTGGPAGYTAVAAQPGSSSGRALLTAVLLVAGGALLGLAGGAIWAALAPRVVYQVATLHPPTAYATNPETNAFIAADGIYTFIAFGGGALLGLAGYFTGVRRYGPVPMAGIILGALAAAYVAKWLGPVLTGQDSFNAQLGSSRPGALLRAPISLGATGAVAFWPIGAGLLAGGLELVSVLRARQLSQDRGPVRGDGGQPAGRHAQPGRGLFTAQPQRPAAPAPPEPWRSEPGPSRPGPSEPRPSEPGQAKPGQPTVPVTGSPLPPAAPAPPDSWQPQPWSPAAHGASASPPWYPGDPPPGRPDRPVSDEQPPGPEGSVR